MVDENFRSIAVADDGIFHDTGKKDQNRIFFYSSKSNLAILENSKVAAGDGTFKIKKSYHRQIFTLHGELNDRLIPLVFVYMKKKSKKAYKKIFKIIKHYIVSFFLLFLLKYLKVGNVHAMMVLIGFVSSNPQFIVSFSIYSFANQIA